MNKINKLLFFTAMTAWLGLGAVLPAQAQIAFRSAAQAISAIRRQWSLTRFSPLFIAMTALLGLSVAMPGQVQAAAPTFQAVSGIAAAANGNADPTVTLPAHAADDVFLLATIVRSGTATVATPAGWTQIGTTTVRAGNATYQFFWKRAASGAETNPSINRTGTTGDVYARVVSYRGAITTGDPWEVKGAVATGTTDPSVIPGITTLTADSLVVAAVAGENNNNGSITTTGTNPAAYTEHYAESGTGANGVITFSEAARAAAGATGNVSVNWNTAIPIGFGGIVLALRPPPPVSVVSINRADPDPSSAATVSWTVIFSQSVTGVDVTAFSLVASGLSGAFISSVTGSGTTWTVTANTGIGSGTLGLNQTGPGLVSPPLTGTFTGQVYTISATPALAEYRMDEAGWNGTAGEVADTSGSYPGTAINSANTTDGSRAIAGNPGTCRYGVFDNGGTITQGYVALPGFPNLNTDFTITGWIRSTDITVGAQRILIDDETNTGGYGLSLGEGGTGILRFYARGSSVIVLDTPNVINNNTWYFVAGVADISNGIRRIYVYDAAGTLLTSVNTPSTGWGIDAGVASIGGETNASGEPPAANHFKGNIDELRVYPKVLSQSALTALATQTHACASLNHIRIEHGGVGLTCEPATVTVKACTDATCSSLYAGNVTTTLSPTGWVGGDTINFSGGSTTAQLRRTTPGVATLDAGTTSPVPANPTLCFNGLTQTCNLDFQDTGFIFSTIPTQIAATTSATQTLRAVRKSDSSDACVGLFNGNVNIDLASQCVNPATCQAGQQVTINNNGATAIAANPGSGVSTWTTKSMTFGANSTASFTMNYPDVGAIRLHARHNIAGSGNYMNGVSNDFVVKPAGFTVTNISRTSDAGVNPGAADAGGAVFMKAGESITLTATAVNSLGAATPNYGKEAVAEGVRLTSALAPGLGLGNDPGLGNGTIPGSAFSAGSATVTNVTWGEVGIITITPGVGDGDYLGAGDVTGTTTGNIGRFTPHNFNVTPNSPVFATACAAGSFTYVGQPFNYTTAPELIVTARNLAGGTTVNYQGTAPAAQAFFKITNTSLTGKAYTAASGTIDASAVTAPDPAIVDNGNGTATLTFNAGSGLFFTRSTPVAPFDADISLAINVIDSDSIAYTTNPARFGAATAGNGITFSDGNPVTTTDKRMRFGRLRLGAVSGSTLLQLRVPLETQYWNGTFFITNVDDSCTTLVPGNVGLGNAIGGIVTSVSAVSPLQSGRGAITLAKPTAGASGSIDLAVNLDVTSSTTATACPQAAPFTPPASGADKAYLRGNWCNPPGTYTKDPSSRARFGIQRGSDETIYIRENY